MGQEVCRAVTADDQLELVAELDEGDSLDLLILELGNDIKKDLRTVDTIIRKGNIAGRG